jgi:hypothetical protein
LLEEWGVLLAVLGLLAATLFLASVHQRYQRHQAEVRAAVRRCESTLLLIGGALSDLGPVPLSRELRVLLRADILARYRRIARLYRGYPDIRQRVAEAETALHAEGDLPGNNLGPIENEQVFRRFTSALDGLHDIVRHNRMLQPLPADVRGIFERELGERRAEVMARFHLVAARQLEQDGDLTKARAHLTTLMQRLRRMGPSTPFVKALYAEAEQALVDLGRRAFEKDAPPVDRPAIGQPG